MSQTDRQTDKAIHWKTAVFDVEDNWSKLENLPAHVKEVHRQKEVCPTTGKEHYQIHVVCHRQVRLKQMTDWIKHTKWFSVVGKDHIENSIRYCSKEDSRAPGTAPEVVKGEAYLQIHEMLKVIARAFVERPLFHYANNYKKWEEQFLFKNAAKWLIEEDLRWISKLSNPVVEKMWNYFHREVLDAVQNEEGSFIIEEPSPEGVELEDDTPPIEFDLTYKITAL